MMHITSRLIMPCFVKLYCWRLWRLEAGPPPAQLNPPYSRTSRLNLRTFHVATSMDYVYSSQQWLERKLHDSATVSATHLPYLVRPDSASLITAKPTARVNFAVRSVGRNRDRFFWPHATVPTVR